MIQYKENEGFGFDSKRIIEMAGCKVHPGEARWFNRWSGFRNLESFQEPEGIWHADSGGERVEEVEVVFPREKVRIPDLKRATVLRNCVVSGMGSWCGWGLRPSLNQVINRNVKASKNGMERENETGAEAIL